MKRRVDDLPVVRASTLVALGDIRRDAKTALIRFDDDGVEYLMSPSATKVDARTAGRSSTMRLAHKGSNLGPAD
jgi:hypothetical protein